MSLIISVQLFAQSDTTTIAIDSVLLKSEYEEIFTIPFQEDTLEKIPVRKHFIYLQNRTNVQSYFFLILLAVLFLASIVLNRYKSQFKKILDTLFNFNMLKQYAFTESKRSMSYLLGLSFVLYLVITLFLYVIVQEYDLNTNILLLSLAIVLSIVLQFIIDWLMAFIFKERDLFFISFFNRISIVLITIPFLILGILLFHYTSEMFLDFFLFAYLSLLAILFLWKELRHIYILQLNKIKIFSFYFFLYLCTSKILPLLVLTKIVYSTIIK